MAAGSFLRERGSRARKPEKQKPGARPGVEKTCVTRDSYPAGCGIVGRRAREVMPAAMRALVRIETLAGRWNIRREGKWLSGRLNDDTEVLRNATTAVAAALPSPTRPA
jgi:hypothetical protein